jgi:DNA adenine methylase
MLRHILPLIPTHNKYVEPFTGGAAVFFGKQPAKLEILNDLNGEVVNFYKCCKDNLPALNKRISSVLHSRSIHRQAILVYKNPQNHNKIERAAAFFILSVMCFGSIIGNSFSTNKSVPNSPMPKRLITKKKLFSYHLAKRFENAIIECLDAVDLINRYDSAETHSFILTRRILTLTWDITAATRGRTLNAC